VGALSVEEILATSAIDAVKLVGADLVPDALVETRGYMRPQFMAGLLTLVVTPAEGGRLQPYELEHVPSVPRRPLTTEGFINADPSCVVPGGVGFASLSVHLCLRRCHPCASLDSPWH